MCVCVCGDGDGTEACICFPFHTKRFVQFLCVNCHPLFLIHISTNSRWEDSSFVYFEKLQRMFSTQRVEKNDLIVGFNLILFSCWWFESCQFLLFVQYQITNICLFQVARNTNKITFIFLFLNRSCGSQG